jgi:hypothetical protein
MDIKEIGIVGVDWTEMFPEVMDPKNKINKYLYCTQHFNWKT